MWIHLFPISIWASKTVRALADIWRVNQQWESFCRVSHLWQMKNNLNDQKAWASRLQFSNPYLCIPSVIVHSLRLPSIITGIQEPFPCSSFSLCPDNLSHHRLPRKWQISGPQLTLSPPQWTVCRKILTLLWVSAPSSNSPSLAPPPCEAAMAGFPKTPLLSRSAYTTASSVSSLPSALTLWKLLSINTKFCGCCLNPPSKPPSCPNRFHIYIY